MAIYKVASSEQTLNGITPPNPYFYSSYTTVESSSSSNYGVQKIIVDSNKNIFVAYQRNDSDGSVIAKYDQYGTVLWAYGYQDSAGYYSVQDIVLDSSGNIYVAAQNYVSYYSRAHWFKLDSNGNILLQKHYGSSAGVAEGGYALSIALDSSGNIYTCGNVKWNGNTTGYPQIMKWDSTGAKVWDYAFTTTVQSNGGTFKSVRVGSDGFIYAVGAIYDTANTDPNLFVVKFNSSGALQWQKRLSEGTNMGQSSESQMSLDSSNNLYISCQTQTATGQLYTGIVLKYNSSGTLQWQRRLSYSGGDVYPRGVAISADGNILIGNSVSNYGQVIVAYNSSGTIQWQQRWQFKNGSLNTEVKDVATDSFGNAYIGVGTSGLSATSTNENGLIKVPAIGGLSFSASLLKMSTNCGTGALTDAAGGLTETTTSITGGASNLVVGSSTSAIYSVNNSVSKVGLV